MSAVADDGMEGTSLVVLVREIVEAELKELREAREARRATGDGMRRPEMSILGIVSRRCGVEVRVAGFGTVVDNGAPGGGCAFSLAKSCVSTGGGAVIEELEAPDEVALERCRDCGSLGEERRSISWAGKPSMPPSRIGWCGLDLRTSTARVLSMAG